MVPLRHWLSVPALTVAGPAAIAGSAATWFLSSYKQSLIFWMCAALIAGVVLLLWWSSAMHDYDRQNPLPAPSDAPDAGPLPAYRDGAASEHDDLEALSAQQIRLRVRDVAARMRIMESAFRSARNGVLFGERDEWDTYTRRVHAQSQEHTRRWQTELLPEAIALWEEMRRRLDKGAQRAVTGHAGETTLEHGMLAGVDSLNETAVALERLARELCRVRRD